MFKPDFFQPLHLARPMTVTPKEGVLWQGADSMKMGKHYPVYSMCEMIDDQGEFNKDDCMTYLLIASEQRELIWEPIDLFLVIPQGVHV